MKIRIFAPIFKFRQADNHLWRLQTSSAVYPSELEAVWRPLPFRLSKSEWLALPVWEKITGGSVIVFDQPFQIGRSKRHLDHGINLRQIGLPHGLSLELRVLRVSVQTAQRAGGSFTRLHGLLHGSGQIRMSQIIRRA
jgi:hypothetical protein